MAIKKCKFWKTCKHSQEKIRGWRCKCPAQYLIICKHNPKIKNYYKRRKQND